MIELQDKTRIALRKFLGSGDGQDILTFLRESVPGLDPTKGDANQIILQAGISEGFKRCIDTIANVITVMPSVQDDLENPSRLSR